jgi:hypothetical protein
LPRSVSNSTRKCLVILSLVWFLTPLCASNPGKIQKAFEALRIYDYFKAKKLFSETIRRKPAAAAHYGLALIFHRNDNPFSNTDSALRHIDLSYAIFSATHVTCTCSGYRIDSASILQLAREITEVQFKRAARINTIASYERFLTTCHLADPVTREDAVSRRDALRFTRIRKINRSDSTLEFTLLYPESPYRAEALQFREGQLFEEMTAAGTASSYRNFLKKRPASPYAKTAFDRLFSIYRTSSDAAGLAQFVNEFPDAPQLLEAWKLLFSLKVKSYSYAELKKFLQEFPDFPLKNSILKELELNKLEMFPLQKEDYTGFIDIRGKFVIAPVYDAATEFSEGLSVVTRNDSTFFINKENLNPFSRVFQEASVFRNGIAPVKSGGKWFFINRQGQTISRSYDEISELSDNAYVVRDEGKYGALDHYGQEMIEPRFEKLGDFRNGFAYYTEKGNYGFVSKNGVVSRAEFEWISDFSESKLAIFRQNNKYGIINSYAVRILEADYDLVLKARGSYLIVNGTQYGFYDPVNACFFYHIAYEYSREKPDAYYTNGEWFRLVRKNDQGFADANGKLCVPFKSYEEISFPSDGLMRLKQKKKYGYTDRKLSPAITFQYSYAEDFQDSLAQVKLKDKYLLINLKGEVVLSANEPFTRISRQYFSLGNDVKTIFDRSGKVIAMGVLQIQRISPHLIAVILEGDEIRLLSD